MKWDDPPAAHKMGMMNRPSIWILDQRPLKIIKEKRVIRQGFGCHQGAGWAAWSGTAGYWWAAGGWSGVGRRRGTICLRKWTKSWDWWRWSDSRAYLSRNASQTKDPDDEVTRYLEGKQVGITNATLRYRGPRVLKAHRSGWQNVSTWIRWSLTCRWGQMPKKLRTWTGRKSESGPRFGDDRELRRLQT